MIFDYLSSPVGLIEIRIQNEAISHLSIVDHKLEESNESSLSLEAKKQLSSYFKRELTKFDLPLDLSSGTGFYQSVWQELLKIPYASTVSYLDISRKLGDPNLTRAVGMANGKNPIAIVVPCHRVIGQDRSLTGYAHGVQVKQMLLRIENPKEYALNGTLF